MLTRPGALDVIRCRPVRHQESEDRSGPRSEPAQDRAVRSGSSMEAGSLVDAAAALPDRTGERFPSFQPLEAVVFRAKSGGSHVDSGRGTHVDGEAE